MPCLTSHRHTDIGTGGHSGDSLADLRTENARLIELLEAHGIEWRSKARQTTFVRDAPSSRLSTEEKVTLFRPFFRGRQDVGTAKLALCGRSYALPSCRQTATARSHDAKAH